MITTSRYKIRSSVNSLFQKLKSNKLKESYVNCSNMPFLKSVGSAAKLFPLVTSILTPFQPTEDFTAIGEEIVSHCVNFIVAI